MATTEAGGGVPQELRDRLKGPEGYETWNTCVDDVFTEIAAAGFELVPVERMDRLLQLESMGRSELMAAWDESDDPGRPEGV